jgi:hypothetical protein
MFRILVFVLSAMLFPSALGAETSADIELSISPNEPLSFQPFAEDNEPAEVKIVVRDAATGELLRNAGVRFTIDHKRGKDILNTGFPYLEGKQVVGGSFIAPSGELVFSYIFPVRGNYVIKVEAFPTDLSPRFSAVEKEYTVHVREHGFEVRNAIILSAFLLLLGTFIGVVYGRASKARGGI